MMTNSASPGFAFADEVDARRQLGDLRVPRDRAPLAIRAAGKQPDVGEHVRQLSLRPQPPSPWRPRISRPYDPGLVALFHAESGGVEEPTCTTDADN